MGRLSRRDLLVGASAVVGLSGSVAGLASCGGGASSDRALLGLGDCGPRLAPEHVKAGIELGARYLVRCQRPAGDFEYEVDWRTGKTSQESSPVRQAGATWGVASHAAETGDPAATAAADKAIGFWLDRARSVPDGVIFDYPKPRTGALGTVVLVAMALAERLRRPEGLDEDRLGRMRRALDGAVQFVRASRRPQGRFFADHDLARGMRSGEPSPYADGEALLLFATLAVRDGRADLLAETLRWAEEDHAVLVRDALAAEPDPASTKGYYQWGSMAWAQLVAGGHDPELWGQRLTDLGIWMIEVHRTLSRTRNTAYAYEGLLPAYAEAKRRGDAELARRFACVAHQGLRKLCSWQLGHPLASDELRAAPEQYHGGVQNHAVESALRVDVTQHQLHALHFAEATGVADHPL